MRNPAIELADMMATWYGDSSTPVRVRGGTHPGDLAFWREQARAVEMLREIEVTLASLGDGFSFYSEYVAEWYRIVFSFYTAWNTQGPVSPPDVNAVAMLRGLGGTMTLAQPQPRIVSEGQRDTLRAAVEDAVQLLGDVGDGLAPAERAYVLRLLASVRDLLEQHDVLGEVDLQTLVDQLVGALVGMQAQFAALDSDDERSGKVRDVIAKIAVAARGFTHDVGAVAAISSGVIDATLAITG